MKLHISLAVVPIEYYQFYGIHRNPTEREYRNYPTYPAKPNRYEMKDGKLVMIKNL